MLELALYVSLLMLLAAVGLAFVRLLIGPSLADRVVALDLMAVEAVCVILVYSIFTDQPVHVVTATVVALIAFLGTVAFALTIQRLSMSKQEE